MQKVIILTMVLSFALAVDVFALTVGSFTDYNLSKVKYENRVRVSNEINDFDYESELNVDSNLDANIDFLETNTFNSSEELDVYLANAHSRYAIANALVWIGFEGLIDSVEVNGLNVENSKMISALDPAVVWPHPELIGVIDTVLLLDIESQINKRSSSADSVATSNPYHISIKNFSYSSDSLRVYVSAFGSIKSGFNSVSPNNSDCLLYMEKTTGVISADALPVNASTPVPEPLSLVMLGLAVTGIRWRGVFVK